MSNYEVVRVGAKPKSAYISAVLFCLSRSGVAKLQGLENRQGKVLDIAASAAKIKGAAIRAINNLRIGKKRGLEIIIKRVEKSERSQ